MDAMLALVTGGLYAAGFYLILRRTLGQLIIGLAILANAANLLIFAAGGTSDAGPPIVPEGATAPLPGVADPVPQALILTAIVIGFGILAFFIVLAYQAYTSTKDDRLDRYTTTDRLDYEMKPEHSGTVTEEPRAESVVQGGTG